MTSGRFGPSECAWVFGSRWNWMRRGVKTGRVGAGVAIQMMILITIVITWTPAGTGMWCTIFD